MSRRKTILYFLAPVLLSLLLHLYVFKLDLMGYHVWRQTQTQTVIYNFSFSDNSILHPQKFDITNGTTSLTYEFPLYQWLIAQLNNLSGYSVMHSRIASFIIFVLFLLGFYKLLIKFVSKEIALICNWLICFSPLLYYYCVNPLPDILALCLSVWALKFFFDFLTSELISEFILFAVFISLAALTKLPYILFGGVFILYVFKEIKEKRVVFVLKKGAILLIFLIPAVIWYAKAIPTWSTNPVTKGILENDKHVLYLLDCLFFHITSSAPELLTNYASCLFLFTGIYLFFRSAKNKSEAVNYFLLLFVLMALYFLFELNAIEKAHDYYLMPFVPLLFLVVAKGVKFFYERKKLKLLYFMICLAPVMAWLRMDHRWNPEKPGFVKDYLTQKDEFHKWIPPGAICIIDKDESKFICLYYLKRHGFSLKPQEINERVLERLYNKGATYLVTENPEFNKQEYNKFIFEEVFTNELGIYKISLK